MKPTYLVCATSCSWSLLFALDEDLDARIALVGVMEPLEMVIMHEKVWNPHKWWHDDPWKFMIIDGSFGNDLGLGIHTYGSL